MMGIFKHIWYFLTGGPPLPPSPDRRYLHQESPNKKKLGEWGTEARKRGRSAESSRSSDSSTRADDSVMTNPLNPMNPSLVDWGSSSNQRTESSCPSSYDSGSSYSSSSDSSSSSSDSGSSSCSSD